MPNITTDETQNVVRSMAVLLLAFKTQVRNLVLNSFVNYANGIYLERIGRDRNLPRLTGEAEADFRARIANAWDRNIGQGDAPSIVAIMESLGYTFNSFDAGDTTKGAGSFNLLVQATGAARFDGTYTFDGSILYDTPTPNSFSIELVQAGAPTAEQEAVIRNALAPIIRASSIIDLIENIVP